MSVNFLAAGYSVGRKNGVVFTSKDYTPPSPAAPVNVAAPAISGTTQTGEVITCSEGVWSGYPGPVFTYQWKRDGVNIGGATLANYLLTVTDEGTDILCAVTATNSEGNASQNSNTVVPTEPPSGGVTPLEANTMFEADTLLVAGGVST